MQDEAIAQRLQQICADANLVIQVIQEPPDLHIYLNRETPEPPNHDALQVRILSALAALNLTSIQTVWLYSRAMGEVEPDWQSRIPLPSIAPADPDSFQLSQYCFIRNRLMLTADLLPPSRSLAQLIQAFHELPATIQAQVLPRLDEVFRTGEIPQKLSDAGEWLGQLTALSGEDIRKAPIWMSRYCFDGAATLAAIAKVLEPAANPVEPNAPAPSAINPAAVAAATATARSSPRSASPTSAAPAARRPQKTSVSPWAFFGGCAVVGLIVLLIVVQMTAPPSVAQVCGAKRSPYCKLLVEMIGTQKVQEISKTAQPLSKEVQTELVKGCVDELKDVIEIKTKKEVDPQQPLKIDSEDILPGVMTTDVQIGTGAQAERMFCSFWGTAKKPKLAAIDKLPVSWPQQPYKPVFQSPPPQHAINAYNAFVALGANTAFTAIGLVAVSFLGLSIRFYSFKGLLSTAAFLGWIETLLVTLLPGFAVVGIPGECLLMLLASTFIKDFKIDWTNGYFSVSTSVMAFIAVRGILHWLLFSSLLSLLS
jgi:hypothetical protein